MAAFRRCTRAGHRSTLIRGLYTEREREAEGEEKQVWSGSGLQSEREKEKRAEGSSAQGRAGNYVSGRRSFGFRAPCTTQDSGGAPSQGRGKETRRRKRERKERRGEERRKRRPERRRERKR